MQFAKISLAVAAFAVSGITFAATNGTPGPTSTGSSVVTIIKQDAVQITKVDDLNFANPGFLSTAARLSDDVCVFSTTTGYNVTLTSLNGAAGAFALSDGTNSFPYAVAWGTTGFAAGAGSPVTAGTALTGQTGDNVNPDCGGAAATNAAFDVTIAAADYNAAPTGTYTDTLTMVVAPE